MFLKISHLRVNEAVAHEVALEIARSVKQNAIMSAEATPMRRKTLGVI
jgi:hypothetical protein